MIQGFGNVNKVYEAFRMLQEYCEEHDDCTGDCGDICILGEYGTGVCILKDSIQALEQSIASWKEEVK